MKVNISDFCDKVDALVEKDFGLQDGGDLCWNLVEAGEIDMGDGSTSYEEAAAHIVAQHMEQA